MKVYKILGKFFSKHHHHEHHQHHVSHSSKNEAIKAHIPHNISLNAKKILDGKLLGNKIKESLSSELKLLQEKIKIRNPNAIERHTPTLQIVYVGHNNDSDLYVRNKMKVCKQMGVNAILTKLDQDVKESKVLEEIEKANKDQHVNGIIVQLPVPGHLNTRELINRVDFQKDVDCLNTQSLNQLESGQNFDDLLLPPASESVLENLRLAILYENDIESYIKDYNRHVLSNNYIDLSDRKVAVIGRGMTAGKPIAITLNRCGANVGVFHSQSGDYKHIVKDYDVIVSAVGKVPNFINHHYIKNGAIVIDVGISQVVDENEKSQITGDVHFEQVLDHVKYITPMPGGVGQTTVIMLIKNVIKSWYKMNEDVLY